MKKQTLKKEDKSFIGEEILIKDLQVGDVFEAWTKGKLLGVWKIEEIKTSSAVIATRVGKDGVSSLTLGGFSDSGTWSYVFKGRTS